MYGGMFGGGMFGNPMRPEDEDQKKKMGGMNPMMMMSPLLGMLMGGHPNMGLGMISPALGISRALGLFK